jgi:glycerol-3-phosphate cytidylyltransferase
MVIGYTTGVFDLFHIGHLNILKKSKSMCDRLIVGVTTDELMIKYKKKEAVIPFEERIEIVQSIKYVDSTVPQESMNKLDVWKRIKFNIMFVGDDWYGSEKWINIEKELSSVGAEVVYFPYTKTTSSTLINQILEEKRSDKEQNP